MRLREKILCPECNLEYLELEREYDKGKCLICLDKENRQRPNYKSVESKRLAKLIGNKFED